jgi:Neu-associated kinase
MESIKYKNTFPFFLQVAIKIIDKNRARKDRYVSKNMRREARLLQMIRHPHIVQLLEIVETSQCYYLVFEFADGGDLMDHICKRKKLDEDEVRKFIRQIISAVEYLHRLGIMHR